MSNLVREMLVGRVGFGESSQARSASYSAEDSMAASIVRLACEADELRAEVAMLREERNILASERDAARAMQKWGMRRELEELLGVADTESDEQFAKGLASLRDLIQERDDARDAFSIATGNCVDAQRRLREMERERDEKAAIFAQLVSLQSGSRRATLEEIAESVREKYQPEHEGEGMQND